MNFKETIEKLHNSEQFKKFKSENEDAYLHSAMFILDYETKINTQQFDFFIPKKNKIAKFMINNDVNFMIDENIMGAGDKINLDIQVEIPDIEKTAKAEVGEQKIKKIIATLQNIQQKQTWKMVCMIGNYDMLNLQIDSQNGAIIKKESNSLMNFMKKVK